MSGMSECRLRWLAVALLAGGLLAACGSEAPEPEAATEAAVAATDAASAATTEEPPAAPDPTTPPEPTAIPPAVFDPDATPLTQEFSLLEPDTYRVDTVGTPFNVTLSERFFVQPNAQGWSVITHRDSEGPDDRDIVVMRPSALIDPTDVTRPLASLEDGWPAVDYETWLDAIDAQVGVTDRQSTTLGGRQATRFDVQLDPDLECSPESDYFCIDFATNNLVNFKDFRKGSVYRIWFVDQDGQDPMAFIVGIGDESHRDWFETAEAVLATVAFGDVAPNPLAPPEAGRTEHPLLGGVAFDADEGLVLVEDPRGFFKIAVEPGPAGTEYLVNPFDASGEPVATSDDLLDTLERANIDVSENESTTVGGVATRVFDLTGGVEGAVLKMSADAPRGWVFPPPSLARIWSIDHPERGLLLITAWAFGPDAAELHADGVAQATGIVESLEFIELG